MARAARALLQVDVLFLCELVLLLQRQRVAVSFGYTAEAASIDDTDADPDPFLTPPLIPTLSCLPFSLSFSCDATLLCSRLTSSSSFPRRTYICTIFILAELLQRPHPFSRPAQRGGRRLYRKVQRAAGMPTTEKGAGASVDFTAPSV